VINYAQDVKSGLVEKTNPVVIEKISGIRIVGIISHGYGRFDDLLNGIIQ
jgi:hypothetical protein